VPVWAGIAAPVDEQPGVYMTYSEVWDDHEGFLREKPEY
jgi:hypothetical protein